MSISRISAYTDLSDAWLGYQIARIRQKHLQFGRHCRLDVDALLARAAGVSRASRRAEAPTETRSTARAEALAD